MIAATIGRKFLRVYNERKELNLTAKEFFEKEYYTIFYNHPKYLQYITNSPFVQMKKGQSPELLSSTERLEKLNALHEKISSSSVYDASAAIGFPASEDKEFATTSGQVTDLHIPFNEEDIYLSWIGSGFGIGVSGRLSIFFDNPDILMELYNGWSVYRGYLNDPTYASMRGNQINTWNGQWLAHAYSKDYRPVDPIRNFTGVEKQKDGTIEITTISWVKVLIGITQKIVTPSLMGYVYDLGKMNTTIGFIPFRLPQIIRPLAIYKKLFGENEYLTNTERIESLYGSAFSFHKACEQGAIGISAMEPEKLRDFIPGYSKEVKMPDYKKAKGDTIITFKTYITWLLAMLNNEELWEIAGQAAENFLQYEAGAAKLRRDRANNIQSVLDATNRRSFIDVLTKLIKEADDIIGFTKLAELVNKMPPDNFQYFNTLIRFRYAEKSKNKPEKAEPQK